LSDETKQLANESNRGAAAQALLDNELFQEGFKAIDRSIWTQLTAANVHDTETITALLMLQKANQKLYKHFESIAYTGRMADEVLARKRRKQ